MAQVHTDGADIGVLPILALETLRGYPAAVSTWLFDLIPARLGWHSGEIWDDALLRFGMAWRGTGKEQMTLGYPEELEVTAPATASRAPTSPAISSALAIPST